MHLGLNSTTTTTNNNNNNQQQKQQQQQQQLQLQRDIILSKYLVIWLIVKKNVFHLSIAYWLELNTYTCIIALRSLRQTVKHTHWKEI